MKQVVVKLWKLFLTKTFIDNLFLARIWYCHQISGRSFSLDGRQFHVCARCTGLIIGAVVSPIIFVAKLYSALIVLVSIAALVMDAGTQIMGFRQSNNRLRLATGLFAGAMVVPAVSLIIGA